MDRMGRRIFIWGLALLPLGASAQLAQLSIVSQADGSPLPGATVQANAAGVAADGDGTVRLTPQMMGPATVRALGHEPLTINLDTIQHPAVLSLQVATYALQPAVVTGQIHAASAPNAVQSVRVIDRVEIDRIGALTLRDVLQTSSGLVLSQDASTGAQVSMLGLSGSHVQVLVDGVPVIGRLDGQIDFDQLPLDRVERVEIVEGPMSVEFGSEAIAGIINLITTGATSIRRLSMSTESVGRHQASAAWSEPVGEQWSLHGRAGRMYFGGFTPDDSAGRVQLWKPKELLSSELRLTRGRLSISAEGVQERLWNDGPINQMTESRPIGDSLLGIYEVPYAQDALFTTRRSVIRTDARGEHAEGFVSWSRYGRSRTTQWVNLTDLEAVPLTEDGLQDTAVFHTFQSRASLKKGNERINGQVGYDVKWETASGARIAQGRQTMGDFAGWGMMEWRPAEDWVVRPGVRWGLNTAYGAPLVPSLHLKFRKFRASYARGFRAPELKELHFVFVDSNHNIVGSEDLQAETSHALQASYQGSMLTDRSLWQPMIKVFRNDVANMIDLALTDNENQLYEYTNLGRVLASGFTAGLKVSSERWTCAAEATAVRRDWRNGGEWQRNENWRLTASGDFRAAEGATFSLQASHNHREAVTMAGADGELAWAEMSPMTILSIYANWDLPQRTITVRAGLENLTGVTNRTISGLTSTGTHSSGGSSAPAATGRNLKLMMTWNFD